jgi:uncharacterized glyoxalase superfamily protein PhnB
MKQAFAAEEMAIHRGPDGVVVHAKVRVGGSIIEMGEAHGEWAPMPTMFYVRGRRRRLVPARAGGGR